MIRTIIHHILMGSACLGTIITALLLSDVVEGATPILYPALCGVASLLCVISALLVSPKPQP
jgi:hypothetical protein